MQHTVIISLMLAETRHFFSTECGVQYYLLNFSQFVVNVGVEKLNDSCRRTHHEKSNKWDAAKDVLMAEKRLGVLHELDRTPRVYQKKAGEYWSTGIKESRRKRPRLHDNEEVSDGSEDISLLTPDELRSRLRDMGVKTRVRKQSRLVDMYNITLQSQPH